MKKIINTLFFTIVSLLAYSEDIIYIRLGNAIGDTRVVTNGAAFATTGELNSVTSELAILHESLTSVSNHLSSLDEDMILIEIKDGTNIVGYTLGGQVSKQLQPRGDYATIQDVIAATNGISTVKDGSITNQKLAAGVNNSVVNSNSTAFGYNTCAYGEISHTEGFATKSNPGAGASHAEGHRTETFGYSSHAEGHMTRAEGYASHAEGSETRAIGEYSHAAGKLSVAEHSRSFVWSSFTNQTYTSNGPGTFNINPEGGMSGVYIGSSRLSDLLGGSYSNALSGMTFDISNLSGIYSAVSNIVRVLGGQISHDSPVVVPPKQTVLTFENGDVQIVDKSGTIDLQTMIDAGLYDDDEGDWVRMPKNATVGTEVNLVEDAFAYCSGLATVVIPNTVTALGGHAFDSCTGLTSVTLPDSIVTVGESAFANCSLLREVFLSRTVNTIGRYAFYSCSSLKTLYVSSGDTDRIRSLLQTSGLDTSGVTFIEL